MPWDVTYTDKTRRSWSTLFLHKGKDVKISFKQMVHMKIKF